MTDIIATIGPASGDVATLAEMIRSGMSVARMNFSHGDYAFHARTASLVREAAAVAGQPAALLADLQGAKVRVGRLDHEVPVADGQAVLLVGLEVDVRERPETLPRDAAIIPVDFDLAPYMKAGSTILIDDGNIELKVESVVAGHVHCRVTHGGVIKSRKGVNVPYTLLPIPALTDKDRADAAFAVSLGVDWIALSFAGSAADVTELREIVAAAEGHSTVHTPPRIMAKIERPDGVENLREIIVASDGVMVARGDLALETSPWQLPLLQKQIVRACRQARKPVVVATQMLESMIQNHRPTRAEVSDVANALLDGADAVMLSGETAVGAYPVQAVRTMVSICHNVMPATIQVNPLSSFLLPEHAVVTRQHPPLESAQRERFVL
ncbi:MAG: pyruvate kinase [Caldilineaceae bacterium]|nr:pyruvate kinase [Caldilineaceae bacterium]